jgi:hypothetical protein
VKDNADRQEQYADRAVALLCQAATTGYHDFAQLKEDPDLSGLRGREDYQRLLAKLAKAQARTPPP